MNVNQQSDIRVLHIVAVPITGAILVAPIARRQADCGYKVEFACGPGDHMTRLKELGFPVTVVPLTRRLLTFSHVRTIYKLWRLLRQRRYQVVHTHAPIAAFLGRIAAALAGAPIVIYHLRASSWESPSFVSRMTFTALEWLVGRWTTYIFTINCTDAAEVAARGIVPKDRVTCLHCGAGGVDTQRFDPQRITAAQGERLREELGLEPADIVVGFVGRLIEEKGIFDLLAAFRDVAKAVPSLKLMVIGDTLSSERDQTVKARMQQLLSEDEDLGRRVIFTGFRDDIPDLMAMTDIVVLPSYYREGFGMVLAEAASMTRPVIATASRGGREAVIPNQTGLLVPIGATSALREALMMLVINPELRRRLGQEGRRRALERFDERVVFEKIENTYQQLLREKGLG